MFTPISITSLEQGKDLAHWHIRRLYGEPVELDIDRSEIVTEGPVPLSIDPIAARSDRRSFLARLFAWHHAVWLTISRRPHRKGCEISAA